MACSGKFNRDAVFQFRFEVSDFCGVVSYSALEVRGVVQKIHGWANVCEWHLRNHAIFRSSAGATLMEHADTRDTTFRRVSTIQNAQGGIVFVGVDADLDDAKWESSADEDVASGKRGSVYSCYH